MTRCEQLSTTHTWECGGPTENASVLLRVSGRWERKTELQNCCALAKKHTVCQQCCETEGETVSGH